MKVTMNVHISGTRNGAYWPEIGGVIDLTDVEAAELCASGMASPVAEAPAVRAEKRPAKRAAEKRG